jgi:Cu(I)/Ag(I) efflux system membrane fusion protein
MLRTLASFLTLAAICALIGYWIGTRHAAPAPAAAEPATAASTHAPSAATQTPPGPVAINGDFVHTAAPVARQIPLQVPVNGKLGLDKQRLRIAASRVAGRLGRIFVFEGQSVKAGQPLAEIYSPDYLSAEREFLLATRFNETLATTADAGLRDDSDATAHAAAGRLRTLGANEADIERLRRTQTVEDYLQVRAPIAGVVIQRNVDPGAYLSIGDTLMSLADPSNLWLLADTYDLDYAALKVGETLSFTTPGLPGRAFEARVSFIAPSFDPTTHTLAIRCDVPNADGALRPEMPVNGLLNVGEQSALVVPKQAVVHVRDSDFLVLRDGDKFRRVQVQGHALGDSDYAVISGLDAGSTVVVDGGVLVDQMLGGR